MRNVAPQFPVYLLFSPFFVYCAVFTPPARLGGKGYINKLKDQTHRVPVVTVVVARWIDIVRTEVHAVRAAAIVVSA